MTLDEAIKVLQEVHRTTHYEWKLDNVKAILLGVEALKLLTRIRENPTVNKYSTLPGETKE